MTIRLFATALIGVSTLAAPSFALEAMRCNVQTKPGLYQPVLRIVSQGSTEDIRMGRDGLSRTIFYRDKEVLDYVAAKMDLPKALMPKSVSGQCGAAKLDDGFQGGQGGDAVATVATAPPVAEPISVSETPVTERGLSVTESDEAAF